MIAHLPYTPHACSSRANLFAREHLRQAHDFVVFAVLRPRDRLVFVQRQHRLDVSQRPPGRLDGVGLAVDCGEPLARRLDLVGRQDGCAEAPEGAVRGVCDIA